MDNDYPTVEQATAAPGERRTLPAERRCSSPATITRSDLSTRRVYCDLELGHAGEHHYTI